MIEIRDRPEHHNNTLIPESLKRSERPYLVPMVNTLTGELRIRRFDERENAMSFISSHDESQRLWPEDFDKKFLAWMMGQGKQ